MIAVVLAAAAAAQPVEDAERAFAALAQTKGQWAAFRATMAPDAIMLAPEMVKAEALLAKLKEPKVAVMWWPAQTVTSCDGRLAFSTGPWRRDGGRSTGRFLTIWQRQPDGGWKWIYDGGAEDKEGLPAGDKVRAIRAACKFPRGPAPTGGTEAGGASPDGSLRWALDPAAQAKGHRIRVDYSTGNRWEKAADLAVG